MFTQVIRAVKRDLCQADENELLVPNPMITAGEDNDFFVGIHTRRPARYGRVVLSEEHTADRIARADHDAVMGPGGSDALDDERLDDVRYLIDVLADFELGALVACRYTLEDDELSWEIFEVEDSEHDV